MGPRPPRDRLDCRSLDEARRRHLGGARRPAAVRLLKSTVLGRASGASRLRSQLAALKNYLTAVVFFKLRRGSFDMTTYIRDVAANADFRKFGLLTPCYKLGLGFGGLLLACAWLLGLQHAVRSRLRRQRQRLPLTCVERLQLSCGPWRAFHTSRRFDILFGAIVVPPAAARLTIAARRHLRESSRRSADGRRRHSLAWRRSRSWHC